MKTKILLSLAAALSLTSCADLGYGVELDSSYPTDPYYYGNGFYGPGFMGDGYYNSPYWNNPLWNYGPAIAPVRPSRPPILNPGVGPALPPSNIKPAPERPSRPPQIDNNPGINGRPSTPAGNERPGNMGLPNNARRGS